MAMSSRRTAALVAGTLAIAGWWLWHDRGKPPAAPREDDRAKAHVLLDLAAYGGGLQWDTPHIPWTGDGVQFCAIQPALASFEIFGSGVEIRTSTWSVYVALEQVTEIVCERHYHHHPEPFVWLYVAFRKGPEDEDGHADELFQVRFREDREPDFLQFCDRHRLRKIGDFGSR